MPEFLWNRCHSRQQLLRPALSFFHEASALPPIHIAKHSVRLSSVWTGSLSGWFPSDTCNGRVMWHRHGFWLQNDSSRNSYNGRRRIYNVDIFISHPAVSLHTNTAIQERICLIFFLLHFFSARIVPAGTCHDPTGNDIASPITVLKKQITKIIRILIIRSNHRRKLEVHFLWSISHDVNIFHFRMHLF